MLTIIEGPGEDEKQKGLCEQEFPHQRELQNISSQAVEASLVLSFTDQMFMGNLLGLLKPQFFHL